MMAKIPPIDVMAEKIAKQALDEYEYKGKTIREWVDALASAGLVERMKGEWIPCSERLPEEDGGLYLVTDYAKSINRKRMHLSRCYMNKEGFWSDVPIGYKVVAWMPLPEPYSGADMRGEKNEISNDERNGNRGS